MPPPQIPVVHFGSVRADRAARALRVVIWAGAVAAIAYMFWTAREHFGAVGLACLLAHSAYPGWLPAHPPFRARVVTTWVAALLGSVLLGVSLVFRARTAWLGLGICCIAWGDGLDAKVQLGGDRSSWRIASGALAVCALGVWLWLELQGG